MSLKAQSGWKAFAMKEYPDNWRTKECHKIMLCKRPHVRDLLGEMGTKKDASGDGKTKINKAMIAWAFPGVWNICIGKIYNPGRSENLLHWLLMMMVPLNHWSQDEGWEYVWFWDMGGSHLTNISPFSLLLKVRKWKGVTSEVGVRALCFLDCFLLSAGNNIFGALLIPTVSTYSIVISLRLCC